jgi:hypothetical protein
MIGAAAFWAWSSPATPAGSPKLTSEQVRLFKKCGETYDARVSNPWAASDIVTWCNRALRADLPEGSHELAVATAMEKVGSILMAPPLDEVAEERAEAEVARLRARH